TQRTVRAGADHTQSGTGPDVLETGEAVLPRARGSVQHRQSSEFPDAVGYFAVRQHRRALGRRGTDHGDHDLLAADSAFGAVFVLIPVATAVSAAGTFWERSRTTTGIKRAQEHETPAARPPALPKVSVCPTCAGLWPRCNITAVFPRAMQFSLATPPVFEGHW